jgi:hypothetical protein
MVMIALKKPLYSMTHLESQQQDDYNVDDATYYHEWGFLWLLNVKDVTVGRWHRGDQRILH